MLTSPRTIHKSQTGEKAPKGKKDSDPSKQKDLSRLDEVDEAEEEKHPSKKRADGHAKRPAKVENKKQGPPIVTGSSNISIGDSMSGINKERVEDSEDDMPTIKELQEENKKKVKGLKRKKTRQGSTKKDRSKNNSS